MKTRRIKIKTAIIAAFIGLFGSVVAALIISGKLDEFINKYWGNDENTESKQCEEFRKRSRLEIEKLDSALIKAEGLKEANMEYWIEKIEYNRTLPCDTITKYYDILTSFFDETNELY